MNRLRVQTAVLFTEIVLAFAYHTESFWWFQKVNWQTIFQNAARGQGEFDTACFWAFIHGTLTGFTFLFGLSVNKKGPFTSEWDFILTFTAMPLLIGGFFALSDLTSGYWMLIEGGKYIPLTYGAFLQPFLVIWMPALLFNITDIRRPQKQLLLSF